MNKNETRWEKNLKLLDAFVSQSLCCYTILFKPWRKTGVRWVALLGNGRCFRATKKKHNCYESHITCTGNYREIINDCYGVV